MDLYILVLVHARVLYYNGCYYVERLQAQRFIVQLWPSLSFVGYLLV